jgi:hypothetical protein
VALEIVAVAQRFGYTVNTTSGGSGNADVIDAVSAIEYIQKQYGMGMLAKVLDITSGAWGVSEHHLYANVLRGISQFLYRFPAYDRRRLLEILRKNPPARLESESGDIYRVLGGARDNAVARVLHKRYNLKLQANRLPEWEDGYVRGKSVPTLTARATTP